MTNLSDNMRGALFMMAGMAFFTFNDVCMKSLSGEVPLFQAIFMRGVLTSTLMLVLVFATGGLTLNLPRMDWTLVGVRTLAESAAAFLFISAVFNMPIGNATAILQGLPLTVTLAGALFLKEPVGWRRLLAILIGFIGILLIVQPGAAGFNSYAIYAVLAVLVITLRDLAVRGMSKNVSSMTIAFVASLGVTILAGLASLGEDWVKPGTGPSLLLVGASFFIIGGYVFSVMTMRIGNIGFIAPFRYTGLLWALVLGLLFFGEWPDALAMLGIAIVVGTGLFTLWRERKLSIDPTPAEMRGR
ncbi:MAG: DMT family transporter [Marinosulfonomonas sp.]